MIPLQYSFSKWIWSGYFYSMILRNFIFISISLLLFSCGKSIDQEHERYSSAGAVENPAFSIDFGTVEGLDETVKARLLANPQTQELMVLLSIMNSSKDTIKLDVNNFQLFTEEGNTVQPNNIETSVAIAPEELVHINLKFSIINSRLLYTTTGLTGDLNQAYQLIIDTKKHTVALNWLLPEKTFLQYKSNHGIEDGATVFMPVMDEDAQKSHQVISGMNEFVYSGSTEIAAAGINILFQSYHLKGTLHLSIKLVNHSIHEVLIYPKAFLLRLDQQLLAPVHNSDLIRLKRSERYSGTFTYVIDKAPIQFSLLKETINVLLADGEKNLFATDLTFHIAP